MEDNFPFNDNDVAILFMIIGIMGIFVQTVVLKPLNSLIGERRVIIVAFLVGALHNYMYGVAKTKMTIFISATIASVTGMSFPTISAIKANNVVSASLIISEFCLSTWTYSSFASTQCAYCVVE